MVPIPGTLSKPGRKLLSLEELVEAAARAKAAGRRVVHCHGVFDLLHIGHIRHFEAARRLGDLLVVTVTPDRYVNKGPHRPAFNEGLRAEAVASLDCVDLVAVNRWPTAVEAIKAIKPGVYAKGAEYKDAKGDVTGGIAKERAAARAVGGRLAFTEDIVFSSSALINRHMSQFPPQVGEFLSRFSRRWSAGDVAAAVQGARRLKVLTVGETIIDEYRYCEAIGKSSKEPTLVVKALEPETFAGGILAVANHMAAFLDRVALVSMLGARDSRLSFIRSKMRPNVALNFLYREDAPTIVKSRYVEHYHFTKLLEVYTINDSLLPPKDGKAFARLLARELPKYDVVVVVDYGHGLLGDEAIKELTRRAKFLVVNAQSNAGNIGYHTIGRYPRVDFACVAENELRMEARDRRGELKALVPAVAKRLGLKKMIVTRGKQGCLGFENGSFCEVPALAGVVQDRVGAGDAFLSLASLIVAQGLPLELAGFVGNAAGAQAVATVGHRSFIERPALLKQLEALLK